MIQIQHISQKCEKMDSSLEYMLTKERNDQLHQITEACIEVWLRIKSGLWMEDTHHFFVVVG